MAVIYATLIIKGRKTISDVPVKIREQVKEILIDLNCPELAEESTVTMEQGVYLIANTKN